MVVIISVGTIAEDITREVLSSERLCLCTLWWCLSVKWRTKDACCDINIIFRNIHIYNIIIQKQQKSVIVLHLAGKAWISDVGSKENGIRRKLQFYVVVAATSGRANEHLYCIWCESINNYYNNDAGIFLTLFVEWIVANLEVTDNTIILADKAHLELSVIIASLYCGILQGRT